MTDDEYRQMVEKRWRESMELLGIEPGPPPAPPQQEPESEPPGKEAVAEMPPEPEEDEPALREPVVDVQLYHRPVVDAVAVEPPPVLPELELEEEPCPAMESVAEIAETEKTEAAVETEGETEEITADKQTGRRRGRRGRRSSRGKKAETAETETGVTEPPAALEAEEPAEEEATSRRGRSRGRSKQAKTADTEGRDKDKPTAQSPDDTEAADDEPEDNWSEWNVPSWQELIASLYRPDR